MHISNIVEKATTDIHQRKHRRGGGRGGAAENTSGWVGGWVVGGRNGPIERRRKDFGRQRGKDEG